jgi:hypothetical protein
VTNPQSVHEVHHGLVHRASNHIRVLHNNYTIIKYVMSQKHISLHSFLVYIMKLSNVIITQHYTTGLLASNKLERMWIELEAIETQLR